MLFKEITQRHIYIAYQKSDPFFIPIQFDPPQQGRTLLISYSETCPRIQYLQSNYTPIVFFANWMHIRSTQIIYILGIWKKNILRPNFSSSFVMIKYPKESCMLTNTILTTCFQFIKFSFQKTTWKTKFEILGTFVIYMQC